MQVPPSASESLFVPSGQVVFDHSTPVRSAPERSAPERLAFEKSAPERLALWTD